MVPQKRTRRENNSNADAPFQVGLQTQRQRVSKCEKNETRLPESNSGLIYVILLLSSKREVGRRGSEGE